MRRDHDGAEKFFPGLFVAIQMPIFLLMLGGWYYLTKFVKLSENHILLGAFLCLPVSMFVGYSLYEKLVSPHRIGAK